MDQAVLELTQKMDALTAQVAYLADQARVAERGREERAELLESVMPIAKDAMRLASSELEEVQDYVDLADLLRLLKKLVRRLPQLEALLDQVDTVTDLVDAVGPIPRQAVDKTVEIFGELEGKGYFNFARSGMRLMDNVVTSFSENDVDRLGDNIVLILNTVKELTQPEIMTFVRNTLQVAEQEVEKPVDTSMRSIMGQLNDPAVRRGLALTLRVLKVVGQQAKPSK
jgi:uncharacterized protein YjgD (DUF1641 family)